MLSDVTGCGVWGQCGAGCLWTGDKRREQSSCMFREKHSHREGRAVVCIPMMKSTQDLFEFACPLLEVITDLCHHCKHIQSGFKQGQELSAPLQA